MDTSKVLQINELQSFRQVSDDIADQLIEDLYANLAPKEIGRLFKDMMNDLEELNYTSLPDVMQDYFMSNQALPIWADPGQIALAEDLFLEIGPEYASCLLARALPIGYTSANVVKVLKKTGYLSSNEKTGTAKRLLETTQFLFNVMGKDAMKMHGAGIKHTLKVRFIHAMIRYHLQKHDWNSELYGIPINQEDMAATIQTFSVSAIMGLERINVHLSKVEKDALVHFWALVGDVIGLNKSLNPTQYKAAKSQYLQILAHQAKSTQEGQQLTKALCNFIQGFLGVHRMPNVAEYLIRYLIGEEEYSDMIGLAKMDKINEKILFNSGIQYVRTINAWRGNPIADRLVKPTNRLFATRLLNYFDSEFDMKLHIPNDIQLAWGLKKAAKE